MIPWLNPHETGPSVFLRHVDEHAPGLLQPFVELFSLDYLLQTQEVLITSSCCCCCNIFSEKTTPIWISSASASCPVTLQPEAGGMTPRRGMCLTQQHFNYKAAPVGQTPQTTLLLLLEQQYPSCNCQRFSQ